eukprot:9128630-Pyramimonas_sp.AAC.1
MSPTAVTLVSVIAGILMFIYMMQPRQNGTDGGGQFEQRHSFQGGGAQAGKATDSRATPEG